MRIVFVLLVAVGLWFTQMAQGGGTTQPGNRIWRHDLMPELAAAGMPTRLGAFRLVGAWRIMGDSPEVGNYSGMGTFRDGTMVTVSDRNGMMTFSRPDQPGPWHARLSRPVEGGHSCVMAHSDNEAMAILPGSEDLLLFYEGTADILRFSRGLVRKDLITLPALREWPANQGPEASVVLADGRLVMFEEGYAPWYDRAHHAGFVYPRIPRSGEAPGRFSIELPAGYRPTELAQLPDRRLLLLERKFTLGGFRSKVAMLDPRDIHPGALVIPRQIASIDDPLIRDNYEGMTINRDPDGQLSIWIISDSNEMVWLQRTLLLRLHFAID